MNTTQRSYPAAFLLRWIIQAVIAGSLAAIVVQSFQLLLLRAMESPQLGQIHPLIIAAAAALVAGMILYRIAPEAAGEGIPAYLHALRNENQPLPILATLFKYPAALITLASYGSGGAVGPIGRVVSGLSQWLTSLLARVMPHLFADRRKHDVSYHAPTTAAISGMAAAIAAIFHSPIAGAVFAVEVIQRDQLRYHQIFPAVLASSAAVFFARIAGWPPIYEGNLPPFEASGGVLLLVVLVGFVTGGLGIAYTQLYRWMAKLFGRNRRRGQTVRLLIGMLLSTLIGIAVNPELLGTALLLVDRLVTGDLVFVYGLLARVALPVALVLLLVAKILTNCLTVASGMSAGFTGPALIVGMLAGAIVAVLFGTIPGTATYSILIVAGMAGMLASTMNTPLAAAILAIELFDSAYGIPAGLAAMIGFQTARYNTIYEAALDQR